MIDYKKFSVSKRWTDMIFRCMEEDDDFEKWTNFITACFAMACNSECMKLLNEINFSPELQEVFDCTRIVSHNPKTGKKGYVGVRTKK